MVEYCTTDELAGGDGLDATLAALSDPTRRAILASLGPGERRVSDIAAPFAMSLNAVSKHVKVLERAGLVRRRRRGREHFLSRDPVGLDPAAAYIETERKRWKARLDTLETLIMEEGDDG